MEKLPDISKLSYTKAADKQQYLEKRERGRLATQEKNTKQRKRKRKGIKDGGG